MNEKIVGTTVCGAAGFWIIGIGIVLCLTGIGAIIGIPLILVGIILPMMGGFTKKDNCPHCGKEIMFMSYSVVVGCPACRSRLLVKDKSKLIPVIMIKRSGVTGVKYD